MSPSPSWSRIVARSWTRPGTGTRGDLVDGCEGVELASPQTLLSAEVPPHGGPVLTAVLSSGAVVAAMSPRMAGAADHEGATVPAMCGDAVDMPLNESCEFVGTLRTLTPGRRCSASACCRRPKDRGSKLAMALLMSNAPAL